MTLEEIFSEISTHMIEGLMVHDQMSRYYCFLGLEKYAKYHQKQYIAESKNYSELNSYYCCHHNKLIKEKQPVDPKAIPSSGYSYQRKDVDITTKKNAVKMGLEKGIDGEQKTLELYSKMYKELITLGAVVDAEYILQLIKETDSELIMATSSYLKKKSCDFDIAIIIGEQ